MKTANDLSSYVGKVGLLVTKAEGLTIRVRVEDARVAWGAVQVKVTPADHEAAMALTGSFPVGSRAAWVAVERVRF